MRELTREALRWAEDGVPVFPCGANKAPLTQNGFYDATTDPTQVEFLFENAPADCKIGGRMGEASGLFAIDLDIYKPGSDGEAAQRYMAQLIADGVLPDTQRHRTMNGGLHLIYESKHGYPNCKPSPGVEVKGEGGYIILPPSEGYFVEDGEGFRAAPKALIDVLQTAKREYSDRTIQQHEAAIRAARDFHDSLTSIAAKMFARGDKANAVLDKLLSALDASVAKSPNHPRHERWAALVEDRGGELSRIVNSGSDKYSSSAKSDSARDSFSAEDIERAKRTAEAAGFVPSPNEGEQPEEPSPEDYDGEWPFEGEGYFASDEISVTDQRFNLYPIYAENESVVIAAAPKSGKTAISLKLAVQVAAGRSLGPFEVKEPRGVLYFALEGTRAIKLRLEAEKRRAQENGDQLPDNMPLFVVERPTNFVSEKSANAAKVVAAARYFEETMGVPLGVVVIDTLTKAMPGADQNSVDDTSALFEFTTLLRSYGVGATVVYVHHTGKDGRTRGSSNIEAEVDVVLKMRQENDLTQMYVHMARSIDDNRVYNFKLDSYPLDVTDQGIQLSAPVVTLDEGNSVANAGMDAKHAAEKAKAFSAIIAMGVGKHPIAAVVLQLKEKRILGARTRSAKIKELLDFLFSTSYEQRFGGFTIIANKPTSEYESITVQH